MKAVLLKEHGKPLSFEEVAEPQIGDTDVLVRVKASGVCQTDLKLAAGTLPVCKQMKMPHILGHESAGVVAEVGSKVEDFKPGDRVAVEIYVGCGDCMYCRQGMDSLCINLLGWIGHRDWGGNAQYVKVPARGLVPMPDNVSFEAAAIITDAVATAFRAAVTRGKIKSGETVLVIGMGGVGIHCMQIVRNAGAKVIVLDSLQSQLDVATSLGAEYALSVDEEDIVGKIRAITGGQGVDAVIEIVGTAQTLQITRESVKTGGRIIVVGYKPDIMWTISPLSMVLEEVSIIGTRASNWLELRDSLDLVAEGRVKPIIGYKAPLEEAQDVHEKLKRGDFQGRAVLMID